MNCENTANYGEWEEMASHRETINTLIGYDLW